MHGCRRGFNWPVGDAELGSPVFVALSIPLSLSGDYLSGWLRILTLQES